MKNDKTTGPRTTDHRTTGPREGRAIAGVGALVLAIYALMAWQLAGSDLTPGYVFTAGEKGVTHTKLNSLVNAATINGSFYTDRAATTTPAATDALLLYSQAAEDLRRITVSDLVWRTPALITNQTEYYVPATNDYLLSYSQAGTDYRKIQLANLWTNWPSLAGDPTNSLPALTNATAATTKFLVYDNGTNAGFGTNGAWGTLTLAALEQLLPQTFSGGPFQFALSSTNVWTIGVTNLAHGLPDTPQIVRWTLLCTNADQGYVAGDEIPIAAVYGNNGDDQKLPMVGGANSSNVFLAQAFQSTLTVAVKGYGVNALIAATNWNTKVFAQYFP